MIGILEMSEASTEFYIGLLKETSLHRMDAPTPFKLIPTDFDSINNLLPHRSTQLDSIIKSYLKDISSFEIGSLLIPNITIHETVDAVWDATNSKISIAHPLFGTIKRMKASDRNKAVVFGSTYTMTADYIPSVFAESAITIERPKPDDIEFIDSVRRQVYHGSATTESIQQFNDLVETYSNETMVLIACTELSIASNMSHDGVIDLAVVQVEDAISSIIDPDHL